MNDEQKRKEDLEAAKGWLTTAKKDNNPMAIQILENFFPELRESEGERIRKSLIRSFTNQHSSNFPTADGFTREQILAWLEKQREKKSADNVKSTEHNYITENSEFFQWIYDRLKYVYNEDPDVDYMLSLKERIEDMQKPADKINAYCQENCKGFQETGKCFCDGECDAKRKSEPEFKIGDWVVHDMSDGRKAIRQIVKMTNKSYVLDGENFNTFYFNDLENDYHLWSIKDVKDGDVLIYPDGTFTIFKEMVEEGLYLSYVVQEPHLFRFNSLCTTLNCHPATKEQHELLFQKLKADGYEWDAEKKELKKIEQSCYYNDGLYYAIDILEKTLGKVEGYQSDDGIIEHQTAIETINALYHKKPAEWNEEDMKFIDALSNCINELKEKLGWNYVYVGENDISMSEIVIWLKSLKDRVQSQYKQEWSEEDEKMKSLIISTLTSMGTLNLERYHHMNLDEVKKWLKSLKPQNHWKPSEKQMEALKKECLAHSNYELCRLLEELESL